MLFTRRMGRTRMFSRPMDRINRPYIDYGRTILVGAGVIFILIVGSLFPLFFKLKTLEENKSILSNVIMQAPSEEDWVEHPSVEELPTIIEQCVKIFQEENIAVHSFNLERFGDENNSSYSYLNFALVRFNLKGFRAGIQNGLTEVEALVNQGIRVQEAHLNSSGGEILLKIYFQEPDNPSSP